MPSHSKVDTQNKTPDHTVPSILAQTGSMSSARSGSRVQGAPPGPPLLGLSWAPHGQQGLCGHSETWRQVSPPLGCPTWRRALWSRPGPVMWRNSTVTLKCPVGSGPWLSCRDCDANLSLHRLKPTWEIPPFRWPSRLLRRLPVSTTRRQYCTEFTKQPDQGVVGQTVSRMCQRSGWQEHPQMCQLRHVRLFAWRF